jgi:hypothetical protein
MYVYPKREDDIHVGFEITYSRTQSLLHRSRP